MTIRFKLTMGFIAVILVLNTLLSLTTIKQLGRAWMGEVRTRVRLDLNSARAAYQCQIMSVARFLEAAALDEALADAMAAGDGDHVAGLLRRLYAAGNMDVLDAVGPDGVVLCRTRGGAGDSVTDNPIIQPALAMKKRQAGTILLDQAALQREGSFLVEQARMPMATATTGTAGRSGKIEGLAVAAAVPVFGRDGRMVGLLYGANLLNNRHVLVDSIRDQVFPRQVYQGKEVGAVTIFQGPTRVSTNVPGPDGRRAVGTQMSDVVRRTVLERGETYSDLALVVGEPYISAYEPIRDPADRVVGALYVGLLEAPFANAQRFLTGFFLVLVGLASAASLLLMFFVTKLVLRPIGHVIDMSRRVVAGDLTARVDAAHPGEMGDLCRAVNAMAEAVAQREEQIKMKTSRQIGHSEKLASIGRLAAGVAHEINNPLTGILTFAHLLREKSNMDDQDRQDLDLIIHETTRVGEIVSGLLDFARERPASKTMLDLNQVIRQTVRLIASQSQFKRITIEEHLGEQLPEVHGDKNQLQQVLLNLALNACEAMPEGGALTLTTLLQGRDVLLQVADTGCGIRREHLNQIFDPFFTTKPVGKGTGLGLSVSYGIVQQHGGVLGVQSEEGRGTTFTILLPAGAEERADAGEPAGQAQEATA